MNQITSKIFEWLRKVRNLAIAGVIGAIMTCCGLCVLVIALPTPAKTPQPISKQIEPTDVVSTQIRPSSIPSPTASPTSLPKPTATLAPTSTQRNVPTIVNYSTLIGMSVTKMESDFGKPVSVESYKAGDLFDYPNYGVEVRTYKIGKYDIAIDSNVNTGNVVGFQITNGLLDDKYTLSDWQVILQRVGFNSPKLPDVQAPAAYRWNGYQGLNILIALNKIGGNVWTVRVFKL